MTAEEFNKKYEAFLEKGHYGLAITDERVVDMLDSKFQEFIKRPGFKYSQIKLKFGFSRFYCEEIDGDEIDSIEKEINELIKKH